MSQKMRSRLIKLGIVAAIILFFVIRSKINNDKVVGGNSRIDYSTEYGKYIASFTDAARPDDIIEISADKYESYTEEGEEAKPEIRKDFEGFTGNSVLTSEDAVITYKFNVKTAGIYEL